jgi:hypothetical protein
MKASTFPRRSSLVFATAIAIGLIACAEEKAPDLIIGTATGANSAKTFGIKCLKNGGGDGQQGQVQNSLADSLCVRVVTATGFPVGGVRVLWSSSAPGAGMRPATSTTHELTGEAKSRWLLGQLAGPQVAQGSADQTDNPVVFGATARAGGADRQLILDGDRQTSVINRLLPTKLIIQIVDDFDNPVVGETVTFLAFGDSGRVTTTGSDTTAITDDNGRVSGSWTLGTAVPLQAVRSDVPGTGVLRITANTTLTFAMEPAGALRYAVREFRHSIGRGDLLLR